MGPLSGPAHLHKKYCDALVHTPTGIHIIIIGNQPIEATPRLHGAVCMSIARNEADKKKVKSHDA